jgi:hypothetical protein
MDFTFFLDGAVWASSARRTSLAVGEPGFPTCTGGSAVVVSCSLRRGLVVRRPGGDDTLDF